MTINSVLTILQKIVDISLVWMMVYFVLKHIKNNLKLVLLFKGVLIIVVIKVLSDALNLTTIGLLLEYIIMWGPLALIIIFQPEIRNILEQLGRKQLLGRHKVLSLDEREKLVYEIMNAVDYLRKSRIGALIVIERDISLNEYIARSKPLYADISSDLLVSIFFPRNPLHDGGVIIQGNRITSAGAVFPISVNSKVSKRLGTRHRAALGISEESDAIALVDINNIVDPTEGITKLDDVNLVAYDSKGNVVDVEMVPSKVSANISIVSPSTTVPIKVIPKGDVEFGKAISSINTSVSTVTVYGEESVISSIQYIPVEIDVTNLSETKTYNVVIEKPNGIRDISETTINVTVGLGSVTEKTISNVKIDTINLDPNYSVQSLGKESSVTSVIVKGTEGVLANIDASMISATVDLSGLGEGEHIVDVIVTGEELKATYTAKPTKITVKIFKK